MCIFEYFIKKICGEFLPEYIFVQSHFCICIYGRRTLEIQKFFYNITCGYSLVPWYTICFTGRYIYICAIYILHRADVRFNMMYDVYELKCYTIYILQICENICTLNLLGGMVKKHQTYTILVIFYILFSFIFFFNFSFWLLSKCFMCVHICMNI